MSGCDFIQEVERYQRVEGDYQSQLTEVHSQQPPQMMMGDQRHSQDGQSNKVFFEARQPGRPSHGIKHIPQQLGEFDGESDQVLLGSSQQFDDTRTVQANWNILQQPVIEEEPAPRSHPSRKPDTVSSVDENQPGATQRVQEAWRRQKLLDDMMADEEQARLEQAQEDESAQEYPVHERFQVNSSRREQQQINPPSLAQMQKQSTMSFGITGEHQPLPPQYVPQNKQQTNNILTTDQSADFYVNTNFPTSGHSQINDASRSDYFINPDSDRPLPAYRQQRVEQEPSSFVINNLKQNLPVNKLETPELRTQDVRKFQQPTGKSLFTKFDQSQLDFYNQQPQLKEPQTEPRLEEFQKHPQFVQSQFDKRSLGNLGLQMSHMSPPQLHQAPQTHYKQPSTGMPQAAEQFLTLDHFLNEQQSPPQYSEPKSHRMPSNGTGSMLTASSRPAHQFHLESDQASQASSLRKQQMEAAEKHRVTNFDGRAGLRQLRGSPRMASTSPLRVDPEEIKRRQLLKQQTLEMKRRQEFEEIRKQAREKEMQRARRLNAAILIQKWVRGHLCRLEHARMRANFRYIRKLRRMLSIAYGRKKSRFIKQIVFVLQETGNKHQKKFQEEIGAFCATLIQKVWRGYHFRRVVKHRLMRQYKSQRLLRALIQGHRTRCTLFRTRECVSLRREILEILGQLRHWQHKLRTMHPATTTKQQHAQIKKSIAALKEDRRVKVAQLIRAINHLKSRGRWVHQLLPAQPIQKPIKQQFRPAQKTGYGQYDPYEQQQLQHNRPMTNYDRKQTQQQEHRGQIVHQPSIQLENDLLFTEAQPSFQEPNSQRYFGDEIERDVSFVFPDSGARQMRRQPYFDEGGSTMGGMHDETARNLIADVGGAHLSPLARNRNKKSQPYFADAPMQGINAADDESDMMWPSQQYKPQQKQQQQRNAANDESDMMWPSQQQKPKQKQLEEDPLAFMWPSQQKKNAPPAAQTLRNKLAEMEQEDSADNMEDDSNAEVAIVWPSVSRKGAIGTSGTAENPSRMPNQNSIVIQSKWTDNKQQQQPFDEQPVGGGGGAKPWDEMPVGGGGGGGPKPWDEQPVGGGAGGPKPWDEMPVGGGGGPQPFDEQPVGGGTGGPKPWDKQPVGGKPTGNNIPAQASSDNKSFTEQQSVNQNSSVLSVAPPKIGLSEFELMIEKAMQEAGEQPGPTSNPNPVPAAKKPNQKKAKKEGEEEEDPAKKKKLEAAAALLEKRKKYDPRKAFKKGKKGAAKKAVKIEEEAEVVAAQNVVEPELPVKSAKSKFISRELPEKEQEVEVIEEVKKPAIKPFLKKKDRKIVAKQPEQEEPNEEVKDDKPIKLIGVDDPKPKPFLKRKTKTMQPAKINWKAKSKLDCWNADSKETKGKNEFASPPQKNPSMDEKTLLESQHELEQSLPKFQDNQPQILNLRKEPSAQPQQKILEEVRPIDDGEFDLDTVPSEQVNCEEEKKVLPISSEMVTNAAWKASFAQKEEPSRMAGNKDAVVQEIPRGGTFAQQQQKQKPQMSGRLPSHLKKSVPTEVDDFDQEPQPRQMMQQTRHNTNRAQANTRQPRKTPPDADDDTYNYNTFSQPDFAQPSTSTFPQLSMGQSAMQEHLQTIGPFNREDNSYLNISEIQGQVSCVMTNTDMTSQGFGTFQLTDRNQMGEEGQSNLQLEELQKVFDLFHTVTETVEEVVPQTSLQRLQARDLPRPHGQGGRIGQNRQQTRKVERKNLKQHTFEEVQIDEVNGQDTMVPHLMIEKSVFFQSYSSDQFEEIFEDLKGHYKRLCDEEPEGVLDDDSQNMSQF